MKKVLDSTAFCSSTKSRWAYRTETVSIELSRVADVLVFGKALTTAQSLSGYGEKR